MKRLLTLVILIVASSHALARGYGSHAGAERAAHLRDNTETHYGGRIRTK